MIGPPDSRNAPCPCLSGFRFKECHGSLLLGDPDDAPDRLREYFVHEHRRKREQGLGKPIESWEADGKRYVRVNHRLFEGIWKTFGDFLTNIYITTTFEKDWIEKEKAKPERDRHLEVVWGEKVCEVWNTARIPGSETYEVPSTGAVLSHLSLAYDLYTLEHNDSPNDPAIRSALYRRLKLANEFDGARHEIRVAAIFIRVGFKLAWVPKARVKTPEFIATYPHTGMQLAVECKMQQKENPNKNIAGLGSKVNDALEKVTDLPRVIFLEVNSPLGTLLPHWREHVVNRVREVENNPPKPDMPPAYVFITNFPWHHHLDDLSPEVGVILEVYKIPERRHDRLSTLREEVDARTRHVEIDALIASFGEHSGVPWAFDGSVRGLEEPDCWIIGMSYVMGEGRVATLISGEVIEKDSTAMLLMEYEGAQSLYPARLSTAQMQAWKRHPDTFFGQIDPVKSKPMDELAFYDWLVDYHSRSTPQQLLAAMKNFGDQDQLTKMSKVQLAEQLSLLQTLEMGRIARGDPES